MSEQLIIAQGAMGLMGNTGPAGAPGAAATSSYPYNVAQNAALFYNIGSTYGQVIFNNNGIEFTGILGSSFSAIAFEYLSTSASYGIDFNNITGASAGIHIANTVTTQIDGPITFNGPVYGFSGSVIKGATGPQGANGATGAAGANGATGSLSFPYNVASNQVDFYNIGSVGSFIMNNNGIQINGITTSISSSILMSNNKGTSYSLWIDNTNNPIQIDAPIVFTNTVISTLYQNSAILFENINGGATQAFYLNNLSSSASAAIQLSNNSGSSYSLWIDNTNNKVQIDAPVQFTGNVNFSGANVIGLSSSSSSTVGYGLFTYAAGQSASGWLGTAASFNSAAIQNGLTLGATPSTTITVTQPGLYFMEANCMVTFYLTPSGSTNTLSNISINVNGNVLYLNEYYQLGQVPYTTVNLPMTVQYISRLNTSDIIQVGYYVGDGFAFPISNLSLIAYLIAP